jgi:hypothetical protein
LAGDDEQASYVTLALAKEGFQLWSEELNQLDIKDVSPPSGLDLFLFPTGIMTKYKINVAAIRLNTTNDTVHHFINL